MSEYVAVTGKLGSGKGLCSVGRMIDYLNRGKPVITNMDIFPEYFKDPYNKNILIYRVPDKPTTEDIKYCGKGNDSLDPEENGVAVFDECATWFNSHDWNSKEAKSFNNLLVHLRKLGWDGIFQIQSLESMNSQAKRNIITSHAKCAHVRKVYLPVITFWIQQFTGRPPKLPRVFRYHVMKMTNIDTGIVEEKLRYKGKYLHKYYDTSQIFNDDYVHGTFCYLTPWHLVGRYLPQKPSFGKQVTRMFTSPIIFLFKVIAGLLGHDLYKLGVLREVKDGTL